MINIYEQVASNKRRSFLIISLFVAFITLAAYLIGYALDNPGLLPAAFIFSLFSTGLSYFWGDQIVLTLNQAKPAKRNEFFDFYTVTENLSLAAGIPVPKIYVINSDAPNAFASGRDPAHAVICTTTGLLQKLNRTELEAVVAHEISHIKNFDTRLMTIVSILVGSLSILINLASHSLYHRDSDNRQSNILAIFGFFLIIFAPIIAKIIQLAISRRREFLADASAVMITRQPGGLISALKKISSDPQKFSQASTATAPLYIHNPFSADKIGNLFSTHPPIAARIKALESMV